MDAPARLEIDDNLLGDTPLQVIYENGVLDDNWNVWTQLSVDYSSEDFVFSGSASLKVEFSGINTVSFDPVPVVSSSEACT